MLSPPPQFFYYQSLNRQLSGQCQWLAHSEDCDEKLGIKS